MKNCWVVRLEVINYLSISIFEIKFEFPPTRNHIDPIVRAAWRRENIEVQDASWQYILILDTIPNIPWIGKLESIYGSVECFNAQS